MPTKRHARLNLLSVREVQHAGEGDHSDGGGLLLRVRGSSATWVYRFTSVSGRRREMGFGVADRNNATIAGKSIAAARDAAHGARALVLGGADPIDARQASRAAKREAEGAKKSEAKRDALTLARACRAYHERVIEPQRTTKHAAQWISSLEHHVSVALWHKPIAEIEAPELFDHMAEVQARVPETARRMLQRLDAVFDDCVFRKQCAGNAAAAIKRKLREVPGARERGEFAALDYRKAPSLLAQLRLADGISARCLEFAVLTAARTNEAIGAQWSEFDLGTGVWTVPPTRMKSSGKKRREKHIVYLSPRALEIVQTHAGLDPHYVFPSTRLDGKSLSNMALLMQLRRMKIGNETTVHGLCRSTFSTWANELGIARPDVIEACLAHQEENRVRAAYNRAQFAKERAALLFAWADYLDGKPEASNVVEFFPQRNAA